MRPRLLADENTSHRLIEACRKIQPDFPIVHISEWGAGACLSLKDPALLMTLRDHDIILAGFDRATMAMHASTITREGVGHSGVILFRRLVSTIDYGRQARLLVELFNESKDWDWADRIEYLPRQG